MYVLERWLSKVAKGAGFNYLNLNCLHFFSPFLSWVTVILYVKGEKERNTCHFKSSFLQMNLHWPFFSYSFSGWYNLLFSSVTCYIWCWISHLNFLMPQSEGEKETELTQAKPSVAYILSTKCLRTSTKLLRAYWRQQKPGWTQRIHMGSLFSPIFFLHSKPQMNSLLTLSNW